ncbi:hypothetical protein PENTCL1PPCAC_25362, partial [Pristionchus entomophagus]
SFQRAIPKRARNSTSVGLVLSKNWRTQLENCFIVFPHYLTRFGLSILSGNFRITSQFQCLEYILCSQTTGFLYLQGNDGMHDMSIPLRYLVKIGIRQKCDQVIDRHFSFATLRIAGFCT